MLQPQKKKRLDSDEKIPSPASTQLSLTDWLSTETADSSLLPADEHRDEKHASPEQRALTRQLSTLDIPSHTIPRLLNRLVATTSTTALTHMVSSLQEKMTLHHSALETLEITLGQDTVSRQERQLIQSDSQLSTYYETFRQQVNRAFLAAQVIMSGYIKKEPDSVDYAIKGATTLVNYIPGADMVGIGLVSAIIKGMGTFTNDIKKHRAFNQLAQLMPDAQVLASTAETTARQLTLSKQGTILHPTDAMPAHSFRVKLSTQTKRAWKASKKSWRVIKTGEKTHATQDLAIEDAATLLATIMTGEKSH